MIATNEAVDVLRHGWQDAASTLAADVPEVAELLQARLEMAVATERLDERHLLDTIEEVETLSAQAGSPSGSELARRLRRTVYEYLLALDAARPLETTKPPLGQPPTVADGRMVGAEEVAALGHASRSREDATDAPSTEGLPAVDTFDPDADLPAPVEAVEGRGPEGTAEAAARLESAPADAPAARRRFALRRRQRDDGGDVASAATEAQTTIGPEDRPESPEPLAGEPRWQFAPGSEPAIFGSAVDVPNAGAVASFDEEAADGDLLATIAHPHPEALGPPGPPDVAAVTGADEPSRGIDGAADAAAGSPTFVAPRAGFHIVDDAAPHRAEEEPRLHMPAFTADEGAVPEESGPLQVAQEPLGPAEAAEPHHGDEGSDFLAWRPPVVPPAPPEPTSSARPAVAAGAPLLAEAPAAASLPPPADSAGFAATPTTQQPAASAPTPPADPVAESDAESRGWGVRKHGDAPSARRGGPVVVAPRVEDDPFENNTRLSDMRRRIEERLRRKRCDEAAALLQEIAQETGGRPVAELAMNAGDRCRALGKSNAALNCYLAAARSDPVYELPLSRLADICIDNQDTELAVSYLERIARIYRFRGEDRAALRTYRRIATIAPYREDVLTLLMNAQRTGQLG